MHTHANLEMEILSREGKKKKTYRDIKSTLHKRRTNALVGVHY